MPALAPILCMIVVLAVALHVVDRWLSAGTLARRWAHFHPAATPEGRRPLQVVVSSCATSSCSAASISTAS